MWSQQQTKLINFSWWLFWTEFHRHNPSKRTI